MTPTTPVPPAPPAVFFYDHPSAPMVVPLSEGYSMTLQVITSQVAHLTISHETDGENIQPKLFLLKCGAGMNANTVPNHRQEGAWMIAYHQDYDLYYKNIPIIRLVHPHCHEIIRI